MTQPSGAGFIAVDKIIADLTNRRGLRQSWEDIDDEIQEEIKHKWASIITEILDLQAAVVAKQQEGKSSEGVGDLMAAKLRVMNIVVPSLRGGNTMGELYGEAFIDAIVNASQLNQQPAQQGKRAEQPCGMCHVIHDGACKL